MKNDVHIGQLIKQRLTESNLSISEFASAIHKTRPTVYDIFRRKSVDTELLISISHVLHFDFISHLHNEEVATTPFESSDKYLIVKIVGKENLEQEKDVLFSCKIGELL